MESLKRVLAQVASQMKDMAVHGGPDKLEMPERYLKAAEILDSVWDMEMSEEEVRMAVNFKTTALIAAKENGAEGAGDQAIDTLTKLSKHQNPLIAAESEKALLSVLADLVDEFEPQRRNATLDKLKARIMQPNPDYVSARVASRLVGSLEQFMEPTEVAAEAALMGEHLRTSDDPKVAGSGQMLQGLAHRYNLPGNPVEIVGTKLDGKDLAFEEFSAGKVVLIDFWATWCGPCRYEFPHMKKLYETYHEHGFEIVGISLDENGLTRILCRPSDRHGVTGKTVTQRRSHKISQ